MKKEQNKGSERRDGEWWRERE